ELVVAGSRVLENRIAAAAIGAALAGNAVLVAWPRRIGAALAGWAGWLVVAFAVIGVAPPGTSRVWAVLAMSGLGAVLPALGEIIARWRERIAKEPTAGQRAVSKDLFVPRER